MDIISLQLANNLKRRMNKEYGGMYETFVATERQTEFTTKEKFSVQGHTLKVYVDGALAIQDDDYVKISENTISFTRPLEAGNIVLFTTEIVGIPHYNVINPEYDDTALREAIENIKLALDDNDDGSILDTLANIKSQWEGADNSLKALIEDKAKQEDMETVMSEIEAARGNKSTLLERLNEIVLSIPGAGNDTGLAEKIELIEESLESIGEVVETLKLGLESFKTSMGLMDTAITELSEEVGKQGNSISEVVSSLEVQSKDIEETKTNIQNLSTAIGKVGEGGLQEDISQIKKDIIKTNDKIDEIEISTGSTLKDKHTGRSNVLVLDNGTIKTELAGEVMVIAHSIPEFTVGEQKEYTVTITANGDTGQVVKSHAELPAEGDFEYLDRDDVEWKPFTGEFGKVTGTSLEDGTIKFRATFNKDGEFTAKKIFSRAENAYVLGEDTLNFIVSKAKVIKTTLESAIAGVQFVAVSVDGSDIEPEDKWTTEDAKVTLEEAVTKAQAVVDNEEATQEDVDLEVTALSDAVLVYEGLQQDGTKADPIPVDKTALEEAILAVEYVAVSEDGSDIDPSEEWTTQEVKATLEDAVIVAQGVVDDEDATEEMVEEAINTLALAVQAYNESKAPGTMEEVTEE